MESLEVKQQKLPTPDELATILEVNSNSSAAEKAKEGWIMSVSKTFCGATATLMAADGDFGSKKMDATLLEVLLHARKQHPERSEAINKYIETILARGWDTIKMSELLSHRSGLRQGDDYLEQGNLNNNLELFKSSNLTFDRSKKGNVFSYCNPGYVLAEDIMSLASNSQLEPSELAPNSNKGYYAELENRIIIPLGLKHTKSIYESKEAEKSASEIVTIEGVMYDWGVKSEKPSQRVNPLETTQKGKIALSEGGLCSSVGDLETSFAEFAKLACGINPNRLQPDPAKTKEIHQFYLDSYKAGEKSESDWQSELSIHCAKHYSLGMIIEIDADDERGDAISSYGNEDKQIRFRHLGGQPGNNAVVSATMPFSFADFVSGTADLKEGEGPKLSASISQKDVFAKDSLLTIVSCDYIAEMDRYFAGKCDQKNDKTYNDESRIYNQYFEAARTGKYVAKAWQDNLMEEGRLPKNFGKFHDEIRAAYAPAQEALVAYVKENFCDKNGVIDSAKVAAGLNSAEDFEKVNKVIEREMLQARATVKEIFAKSDRELEVEKRGVLRDGAEVAKKPEARQDLADGTGSWAKRVGNPPNVPEVRQAFVERVQKAAKQDESWKEHVAKKDMAMASGVNVHK